MKKISFRRIVCAPFLLAYVIAVLTMTASMSEAQADGETAVKVPSLSLLGSRWNFVIHIKAQKDGDTLNLAPSDVDLIEGGDKAHECTNDPGLPNNDAAKCDHLKASTTPIYIELYVSRVNPTCVTYNLGGTWYSLCR